MLESANPDGGGPWAFERVSTGAAIAALLTVGFAAWPTAAAAAGPSDSDKEKIPHFEWAAASQTEGTESKRSPISLRLFGGFGRVNPGDLNEGLDGYYEVFKLYSAQGFGTATGGYNPLRDGYHAGADLVFQITPKIGIGIGAGYMRFTESSDLTLSFESASLELSSTPTVSAVPIRLGLFLTLPLGKRLDLTAGAGVTAYADLKLEEKRHLKYINDYWTETSLSASRKSPLDNIGYHGSLGFEWRIFPNTGFFVEAVGQYARFGNFKTVAVSEMDSHGEGGRAKAGSIWRYTVPRNAEYSYFTVEESAPLPDSPNVTLQGAEDRPQRIQSPGRIPHPALRVPKSDRRRIQSFDPSFDKTQCRNPEHEDAMRGGWPSFSSSSLSLGSRDATRASRSLLPRLCPLRRLPPWLRSTLPGRATPFRWALSPSSTTPEEWPEP